MSLVSTTLLRFVASFSFHKGDFNNCFFCVHCNFTSGYSFSLCPPRTPQTRVGWEGAVLIFGLATRPITLRYFPTQRVRGDWVSTESTVHSCLKSQANKNPLVEGPEAEWIQQTVFVQRNRTGSANARLDLPLFQQQMEKKKVCGEWLSRCQLSCFALSAVSHFKFWFCLIYVYRLCLLSAREPVMR